MSDEGQVPVRVELMRRRPGAEQGRALWRSLDELAQSDAFREVLEREFPEQASEWDDPEGRRAVQRGTFRFLVQWIGVPHSHLVGQQTARIIERHHQRVGPFLSVLKIIFASHGGDSLRKLFVFQTIFVWFF
jgi:MoCo/4Fe-4S cofactor protein with predicted Tat translocation signal